LVPFRSLRDAIYIFRKPISETDVCQSFDDRPLWLNKAVRYKIVPLWNAEMVNAGITDYGHLLDSNGELQEYDKIAEIYA